MHTGGEGRRWGGRGYNIGTQNRGPPSNFFQKVLSLPPRKKSELPPPLVFQPCASFNKTKKKVFICFDLYTNNSSCYIVTITILKKQFFLLWCGKFILMNQICRKITCIPRFSITLFRFCISYKSGPLFSNSTITKGCVNYNVCWREYIRRSEPNLTPITPQSVLSFYNPSAPHPSTLEVRVKV